LEEEDTTEAINRVIAGLPDDHEFTDTAAAALAGGRSELSHGIKHQDTKGEVQSS
jgi:hypothetical protein